MSWEMIHINRITDLMAKRLLICKACTFLDDHRENCSISTCIWWPISFSTLFFLLYIQIHMYPDAHLCLLQTQDSKVNPYTPFMALDPSHNIIPSLKYPYQVICYPTWHKLTRLKGSWTFIGEFFLVNIFEWECEKENNKVQCSCCGKITLLDRLLKV